MRSMVLLGTVEPAIVLDAVKPSVVLHLHTLSWRLVARSGGTVENLWLRSILVGIGPSVSAAAAALRSVDSGMGKSMDLPSGVWTGIQAWRSRCTYL